MGGNCRERERNFPSGIKFRDLSLKRVTQLLPNTGTEVGNAGESTRSGQRWFLTLLPLPTSGLSWSSPSAVLGQKLGAFVLL